MSVRSFVCLFVDVPKYAKTDTSSGVVGMVRRVQSRTAHSALLQGGYKECEVDEGNAGFVRNDAEAN
jgi:hypothetical protein